MSQKEPGRPDLNRREKGLLEITIACKSQMMEAGDIFKDRLKSEDPRGWNYWRTALGLIDKAQELIYETVPTRQLLQLQTMCRSGRVVLAPSPYLMPQGYTPVNEHDMNTLIGAAVNNKCALCVLNEYECRQCELMKTLKVLWPPLNETEMRRFGCPYQGVKWEEPGEKQPNVNG